MPGKAAESFKDVKKMKGIVKAFPVFGRYDIVAFVQASDFNSVLKISKQINAIKGIRSTETAIEG
jgi:DNA-binding Lrp family transcriptional regulator